MLKVNPSLTLKEVRSLHRSASNQVHEAIRRKHALLKEAEGIDLYLASATGPGFAMDSFAARIIELKRERDAAKKKVEANK